MELWKWHDVTRDFWSRLAKAVQRSNISVKRAEQLDSRLASVQTTGKMKWAAETRSIRECKMGILKNGGASIQIQTSGMGSRSNNMGADVGGKSSHATEHSRLKTSWTQKNIRLAWNSEKS